MELFLSKLRAYKPQPSALRIFIIQFLTECCEFLCTKAGTTGSLQNKRFLENS